MSKPAARYAFLLTAIVPSITLSACAPAAERGVMAHPGAGSGDVSAESTAVVGSRYVQADVDFMHGMLHHHAQAVLMTDMVETRTTDERVRLMARRIEMSQEGEMEMMVRWLQRRGEEVPDLEHAHHGMHADMPGMLSQDQLERLAAASGAAFDRLFLEYMILHHEGALVMVQGLLRIDGAGQETEIFQFAMHVDSDQRVEIDRMRAMLDEVRG